MAKTEPALDKELDRLYALPPEDFVSARNALAARLQKEGRKKDASRIKALRKPSASAWLVNQLVRKRRGEVDALLAAGGRVRAGQREAMGGGGGDLRAAMQAERKAIERVRRALDKLAARGQAGKNPATADRALSSLRAIAEGAEAPGFQEGWLTEDIASPGLDALVDALGPRARATPPRGETPSARGQEKRKPAPSPLPAAKPPRKGPTARQREQAEARAQRIEEADAALRRAEAEARALEAETKQAKEDERSAREEAQRAALEAKRAAQEAERREQIEAMKAEEAAAAKRKVALARRALEKARRLPRGPGGD
jgi:hypothetical protein